MILCKRDVNCVNTHGAAQGTLNHARFAQVQKPTGCAVWNDLKICKFRNRDWYPAVYILWSLLAVIGAESPGQQLFVLGIYVRAVKSEKTRQQRLANAGRLTESSVASLVKASWSDSEPSEVSS